MISDSKALIKIRYCIIIINFAIINSQTNAMEKSNGNGKDEFPKTLEEFGYKFNEKGQLRQLENEEAGFVFEVKPGDKAYNQRRYEALGEVITEEIYKLLETKAGLKRIYIPVDADDQESRGFFFASDNAWTSDRTLVLIHGSGVVRAGQWTRKLIMNDDIDTGSQLPYILDAMNAGFGVVVLNTNQYRALAKNGKEAEIRGSEDPLSHALYVWDQFIHDSAARHIAIVAHSAGGYVTVNLAHERWQEFEDRVFAVAFTDSVHSQKSGSPVWGHLLKVSRNWVTSRLDVGEKEKQRLNDVERVSAGTLSHERTSASAFEDIRKYIYQRYEETAKTDAINQKSEDEVAKKLDLSSGSNEADISSNNDDTADLNTSKTEMEENATPKPEL